MSLIVNITKKLNNFTLNVDFNVEDEIFAILGASGCGKSMTLKCIAGIETPDNGHIEFNKKVLEHNRAVKDDKDMKSRKRPTLFVGVPHIFHKGSIDVSNFPVIVV